MIPVINTLNQWIQEDNMQKLQSDVNPSIVFKKGDVCFDKTLWAFRQFRGFLKTDRNRVWVSFPCEYYADALSVAEDVDVDIYVKQFLARMIPIPDIRSSPYATHDYVLEQRYPHMTPVWKVKAGGIVNGQTYSAP